MYITELDFFFLAARVVIFLVKVHMQHVGVSRTYRTKISWNLLFVVLPFGTILKPQFWSLGTVFYVGLVTSCAGSVNFWHSRNGFIQLFQSLLWPCSSSSLPFNGYHGFLPASVKQPGCEVDTMHLVPRLRIGRGVDCGSNVMAHAQKPDFVFRRNGRVHLNRRGRQFSRLLAAEVCASAVIMLDTPCSDVVCRVLATHSIRQFPLYFPSCASPCGITFQLDS